MASIRDFAQCERNLGYAAVIIRAEGKKCRTGEEGRIDRSREGKGIPLRECGKQISARFGFGRFIDDQRARDIPEIGVCEHMLTSRLRF